MDNGFNFEALIDALADKVAAKVAERVGQQRATGPVTPRLLTVEQAANFLGRTEEGVRHLIASGRLRPVKIDRRVFIDVQDLERLIEDSKA